MTFSSQKTKSSEQLTCRRSRWDRQPTQTGGSQIFRPDLDVQPIRGNVDTRLNKVRKGEFAGIVIAEAGLERMNLEKEITERLPLDQFPSAAGQGAIAVVAKEGNECVISILRAVEDKATRAEITAERSLVLCVRRRLQSPNRRRCTCRRQQSCRFSAVSTHLMSERKSVLPHKEH